MYERTTNTIFKPRKFITKLQHSNYSKYGINALAQSENEITPNQILMFCFRPESYVKLHRIEHCIPEISSLKEEDAKWKINIKHEPACALNINSEMKIKKEPGSGNEKPLKHYPGYTPTHDLSVVKHDPGYTPPHDLSVVKHDPGYTPAHDLSVEKHDPVYTPAHDLSDDGDGDVDLPEKIIKTEPDVIDGKTGE